MSQMKIVQATLHDASILLQIERTAASKTYSTVKNVNQARNYIRAETILWLYENTHIVGKISYKIGSDGNINISGLIILPVYQHKGYGRFLVDHVLGAFPSRTFELTVHPENKPAISLYKSFGFVSISTLENPYGDGEPRILMIKHPITLQR